MNKAIIIALIIAACSMFAQGDIARGDDLSLDAPTKYDSLKIKHRARTFAGEVTSNRQLYIYLDVIDLARAQDLEEASLDELLTVDTEEGIREINVLIESRSPKWLRLDESALDENGEICIGTVMLGEDSLLRNTTVNTILLLSHLEIVGDTDN